MVSGSSPSLRDTSISAFWDDGREGSRKCESLIPLLMGSRPCIYLLTNQARGFGWTGQFCYVLKEESGCSHVTLSKNWGFFLISYTGFVSNAWDSNLKGRDLSLGAPRGVKQARVHFSALLPASFYRKVLMSVCRLVGWGVGWGWETRKRGRHPRWAGGRVNM